MPIQHLLYRCPRCGHDPTTATSRGARCDSCGTVFEQGRASVILVRSSDGEVAEVSAGTLIGDMERLGGPASTPNPEEELSHEARVALGRGNQHQAVWWKGSVLGFIERLTERREGTLRLDGAELTVTCAGREPLVWHLESICAIQISSRAIQLYIRDAGLHQMEFSNDSPKRWEDLLHMALRRFYATLGQEVEEFQPRIVTRARS